MKKYLYKTSIICLLLSGGCSHKDVAARNPAEAMDVAVDAQRCIQSICGTTEQNVSSLEADSNKTVAKKYTTTSSDYKKVQQALSRLAYAELGGYARTVSMIEDLLKNPTLEIPISIRVLINSGYFYALQNSALVQKKKVLPEATIADLNPEDYRFFNLDKNELVWIAEVIATGYFSRAPNIDWDEKLYSYLDRKFPNQLFKKSLPQALSHCHKEVHALHQFMGNDIGIDKEFIYCTSRNKTSWTRIDENKLVQELKTIELLSFLAAQRIQAVILKRNWDWFSHVKQYAETDTYKVAKRVSQKTSQDLEPFVRGAVNACQEIITGAVETAPTRQERETAVASIKDIREKARKLFKFNSPQAQKNWEKQITSTWYVFPMESDIVIKNILARLNSESLAATRQDMKNPTQILLEIFLQDNETQSVKSTPVKQDLEAIARALKNLRDICKDYDAETLTDRIYASDGNVYLSWFTLRYPEKGYGIMAHEMGHHVSQLIQKSGGLSEGSLWDHHSCVEDYHTLSFDINGAHPYAEEDWADYFAGSILKLKKAEGKSIDNFSCALLRENDDGYDTNLESDGSGLYSTPFFRLLHIEKTSGQLSDSCRKIVSNQKMPACF